MTQSKLTRSDIVQLGIVLTSIGKSLKDVRHRWTATAMRTQLKPFLEIYDAMVANLQELNPTEYNNERESICKKYCARDDKGQPSIKNNNYVIADASRVAFEGEVAALRTGEKYKAAVDTFEAEAKKFNAFMAETVSISVTVPAFVSRLKLSWFTPEAEIPEVLFPFIEDDVAQ